MYLNRGPMGAGGGASLGTMPEHKMLITSSVKCYHCHHHFRQTLNENLTIY